MKHQILYLHACIIKYTFQNLLNGKLQSFAQLLIIIRIDFLMNGFDEKPLICNLDI